MTEQTFREYLGTRWGKTGEGPINEFVSRVGERLIFGDRVDLGALVAQYGAPLEVAFCPLITREVRRMQQVAAAAQSATGYPEAVVYAYATKANFAEEVVRTALAAGAHYETSSAADVQIATLLWQNGTLAHDRWVFCNGSKDAAYQQALVRLRLLGNERVVAVLDDRAEWEQLSKLSLPLLFGVRARQFARCAGADRFGLLPEEITALASEVGQTDHRLVLYHAMVGSQIEDEAAWLDALTAAVEQYCALWKVAPSLRMFNFGGGMPTTAYDLGFKFDYEGFFRRLFATIKEVCGEHDVPVPQVVGEFGRYTVASHCVYLFEVAQTKAGRDGEPAWYLIDGSLMVSAPDTLIVDQEFTVLPIDGWDDPVQPARLGGRRTCDSDDVYPRPDQAPLMLPATEGGLVVAVFGVGAYQQMLGGRGGAHHCLNPEMRRLIIEEGPRGLELREIAPQSLTQIMAALGYDQSAPLRRRTPWARRRVEAVRTLGTRPARVPVPARTVPPVWADG